MDKLLSPSPGLVIWTILNFIIFFFVLKAILNKSLFKNLRLRSEKIAGDIAEAERLRLEQTAMMKYAEGKLNSAQQEMAEIIAKGKEQKERMIREASEEAEAVKRKKVADAAVEIDRLKENAIKQLRTEVASLVVEAAEKILGEALDPEKHKNIIKASIEKLPSN